MTNDQVLEALQHLIGTRYVPTVKEYITELTARARITGPNEMQSREMDPNRITIRINGDDIESFTFG